VPYLHSHQMYMVCHSHRQLYKTKIQQVPYPHSHHMYMMCDSHGQL
jgi:hypothetical protein